MDRRHHPHTPSTPRRRPNRSDATRSDATACATLLSLRHASSSTAALDSPPTSPKSSSSRFWQTVMQPEPAAPPADMHIACVICGVRFRKSGHLNMHWRSVHPTAHPPSHTAMPSIPPPAQAQPLSPDGKQVKVKALRAKDAKGRAYGCPQCDAWFKRGSDRNRHMRMVHAKIRPFVCAVCGNCFGRKSFLEAHVLTVHEKLRPFQCACGAAFGQRSSLTRHARKIHGKNP